MLAGSGAFLGTLTACMMQKRASILAENRRGLTKKNISNSPLEKKFFFLDFWPGDDFFGKSDSNKKKIPFNFHTAIAWEWTDWFLGAIIVAFSAGAGLIVCALSRKIFLAQFQFFFVTICLKYVPKVKNCQTKKMCFGFSKSHCVTLFAAIRKSWEN